MELDCKSSTGLGETETSLLKSAHKISGAQGPRAKAVIWQEPRPELPASLGESPGEAGFSYGSPFGHGHW